MLSKGRRDQLYHRGLYPLRLRDRLKTSHQSRTPGQERVVQRARCPRVQRSVILNTSRRCTHTRTLMKISSKLLNRDPPHERRQVRLTTRPRKIFLMWEWWEKNSVPSKSLYWKSYRILEESKMERIVVAKLNALWKLNSTAVQYDSGHLAKCVRKKSKPIYDP